MKNMKTAPKDGSLILVYDAEDGFVIVSWIKNHIKYAKPAFEWCIAHSWQGEESGYTVAEKPLCWMSLPDKPIV